MEEQKDIKKAIIPIAGLGTRFLPLSKTIQKVFFPLVDKPVIQYIIEEVKKSGIKEIIFIISPGKKDIINYFQKSPELEKILIKTKREKILKEMKEFEEIFEGIKFSFITQKNLLGDGHALSLAARYVEEPVAVSFGDDVVDSDEPALAQLINIFKTCTAPIVALKQLPKDKVSAYGVAVVEKIANRLYKIKKIIEKPAIDKISSDLVIVGKYILTPDVFKYLKKSESSKAGETILAEVLDKMLNDGKTIYGYELRGEWLECGDKLKWLKSFFYLALKDPRFKDELKQYL